MSRYGGGLDLAVAHVDSCVADVLGARGCSRSADGAKNSFPRLGRRLEGTKERRKMGHREEEGEEKERRKGGRDFRRLTHMRWKCQ